MVSAYYEQSVKIGTENFLETGKVQTCTGGFEINPITLPG